MTPLSIDDGGLIGRLTADVWEIGLAVLSHRGVCRFFKQINHALDRCDLEKLRVIREAVDTLPAEMQAALLGGSLASELNVEAVCLLEEIALELLEGGSIPEDWEE